MNNYISISNQDTRNAVCEYLKTFLTENRIKRIEDVLSQRTKHITVVLEDLYQTQNMSAAIRTCECYGLQDVYVIEGINDFQIHNAISMGANKWINIHQYPRSQHNIEDCINTLHQSGYTVVATLPSENDCFIEDLPVDRKTAFLFGTELTGLTPKAVALADSTVKINMYGFTESLNISNSVAIIVSQFVERLRKSSINWQLSPEEKQIIWLEWLQKSLKTPDLLIEKFLFENNLSV